MKRTRCEQAHLGVEVCVHLYCALLSVADPVLDLVVGFNYLSNNETGFGIATLILCFVPTLMLSASSLHWIVYDKAINKLFKESKTQLLEKGYRIPADYTTRFLATQPTTPTQPTQESADNTAEGGVSPEDVKIHPPEPVDQIETDNGNCGKRRVPRVSRACSTVVDGGISKVPIVLSAITKPNFTQETFKLEVDFRMNSQSQPPICPSERSYAYEQIMAELGAGVWSVKPSLKDLKLREVLYHLIGIPGVFRHVNIIRLTYRNYKKRSSLVADYRTFVKEAEEKGIKEVYFNPDLAELFHARRDAALLRLMEGAYEATPQLLLQLYIIAVYTRQATSWLTCLSVATSFSSLVFSMTSYIYEQRKASYDKADMKIYHFILLVSIKLCMSLSRIAAFLSAATYSSYLPVGVALVHWLACLLVLCCTDTHFYGGFLWSESFFKVICSFTLILTFINVVDGKSQTRWLSYHGFVLLQNMLMLMLWYSDRHPDFSVPGWEGALCIALVIGGMAIGTLLTILYYKFFHPTKKPLEVDDYRELLEELLGKYQASTLTHEVSLFPQLNAEYQTTL